MFPLIVAKRFQRWIDSSIHRRLIVGSMFFWLFSVSALGLTFLQVGHTQILDETRQRNVQLASVVSRDVNAKIGSIFTDIRVFARHLELLNPNLDTQAAALLALRLSSPQRTRAVYYFENNGELGFYLNDTLETLFSLRNAADIVSRPRIQVDPAVVSTYRMASNAGTHLSDLHFAGIDRIPVSYVGVRITFPGERERVVVLEVDLSDIWQRVDLSTVGQTGFAYAVSEQGDIIAHPDRALLGRRIAGELEPLIVGYEGSTAYTDPWKQRKVLAAYSPVGGRTGWGIVVQQDEDEVNAALFTTGLVIVSIWLTLAVVGTMGILLLARSFTGPIEELTNTTQSIARTGYLTKTTLAHRRDEIGQLSQAFDQMIERLQTTESRLATAAAEERNRLARDLHDAVTQTLFSASLIAEVLPILWERNETEGRRRLEEVRQLTRGALAEMRILLLELRPSSFVEAELPYLLRQLAESITGRSRVPVAVEVDGHCALPNEAKISMYRIAQEALNNMAKHSGASEARVCLICQEGLVTLSVTDNGRGFDMAGIRPDSLGLSIMRERAQDLEASLTIDSSIGHGTRVEAVWRNGKG